MRRPTSVRAPAAVDRAQPGEQLARRAPGGRGRRLEPGERVGVADAERRRASAPRRSDRRARSRAGRRRAALLEVVLRVEPQRASGPRPAGAAGPLRRPTARLIFASASVGRPVQGECAAMRARPASTTATTPSIVTDDSATLVARTTLRRPAGRTARVCSSSGISPCSGRIASVAACGQLGERGLRAPDLAGAREKHQQVAVGLLAQELPHRRPRPRRSSGRSSRACAGQVLDRRPRSARPSLRTVVARRRSPARNARTGSASSVADIATTARSGRAASRSRRSQASARSVATCRSWSSSSTTAETPRQLADRPAAAARTAPRS